MNESLMFLFLFLGSLISCYIIISDGFTLFIADNNYLGVGVSIILIIIMMLFGIQFFKKAFNKTNINKRELI